MSIFLKDEKGISSIVGMVIIVGLALSVGLTTYITSWVNYEQNDREYNTMRQVEQSFRDLKSGIASLELGSGGSVGVKLGAEPVSAYGYPAKGAVLTAVTARDVDWVNPVIDTYVNENAPYSYFSTSDNLLVSPENNHRKRTFLKFDLGDSTLYDSANGRYYDDAIIVDAKLWLYAHMLNLNENESLQPLEIEVPVMVEAWSVEDDSWTANVTWAELNDDNWEILSQAIENQLVDDEGDWYAWDVTSFVKKEFEEIVENQVNGNTIYDSLVSLALAEASGILGNLQRRAGFVAVDETQFPDYKLRPVLEIVFAKQTTSDPAPDSIYNLGYSFIESGYLKFQPYNYMFPEQYFIYEGGMLIQQQYGWYDMVLPGGEPEEMLQVTLADGNNINVTLTRYRIASVNGVAGQKTVGGTGWASVSYSIAEERYITQAGITPNRSEVTLIVHSDDPRGWRDHFSRLAARLNYLLGGVWSGFEEWVNYSYNRVSLTIRGRPTGLDPNKDDIYFTERVVDLNLVLQ